MFIQVMLGVLAAQILFAVLMFPLSVWKTDATDSPDKRSGMAVLVDHETGVQYLALPNGGLTPRITANGEVMCFETKPITEDK